MQFQPRFLSYQSQVCNTCILGVTVFSLVFQHGVEGDKLIDRETVIVV